MVVVVGVVVVVVVGVGVVVVLAVVEESLYHGFEVVLDLVVLSYHRGVVVVRTFRHHGIVDVVRLLLVVVVVGLVVVVVVGLVVVSVVGLVVVVVVVGLVVVVVVDLSGVHGLVTGALGRVRYGRYGFPYGSLSTTLGVGVVLSVASKTRIV